MKELFFNGLSNTARNLQKLRLNVPNTIYNDMGFLYLYNGKDN